MRNAVKIRIEPAKYSKDEKSIDNSVVEHFADVIDEEFAKTIGRFAETELNRMNITFINLPLIRNKDGVSVWRVAAEADSYVMKCFDKPEYRREIDTNLAVARDRSRALVFDYNFFYKSYVYSDIRNVCLSLGSEEAKAAFLSAYGGFDEREVVVDNVACELSALIIACQRKVFPNWANGGLEKVKDGRLLASVEKLLGVKYNEHTI